MKPIQSMLISAIFCVILLFITAAAALCGDKMGPVTNIESERLDGIDEFLFTGEAFEVTFLQPTVAHQSWGIEQWRSELRNLRRIGVDTLIVQWSRYDGVDFVTAGKGKEGLIELVAKTAGEFGLDLYVGLSLSKIWSQPQVLNAELVHAELEANKALAKTIYTQLGRHLHFRGWYIPHELTDVFYNDEQRELILRLMSGISGYLNRLDPMKRVIASGYTLPDKSHIVRFTLWWALEWQGKEIGETHCHFLKLSQSSTTSTSKEKYGF